MNQYDGSEADLQKRFWLKVDGGQVRLADEGDACWLWTGQTIRGYAHIKWRKHSRRASHVSLFIATGCWPTQQVLHRCDNARCVHPAHLIEGTSLQNMHDKLAKGRHRGRKRTARVEAALPEIRTRLALNEAAASIARSLGLDRSTVSRIASGRQNERVVIERKVHQLAYLRL